MKNKFQIILLLGILLITFTTCGIAGQSPTDVLKAYHSAIKANKFQEVASYLSSINSAYAPMVGMSGSTANLQWAVKISKYTNDDVEKWDYLGEQIKGEEAIVRYRVYLKNKTQPQESFRKLIKEKGDWKVVVEGAPLY